MALETVMTTGTLPERNKKRNVAGFKDSFKKRFGPGATSAASRNAPKNEVEGSKADLAADKKKNDDKMPARKKK